jgi:mannose-1-phosphate guanylyltransferase / mannose-6-phosphate isomerase
VPETGFGYIEVAEVTANPQPVLNFVEKPDHSRAMEYLATGRYYWNSGMFCFTASALLDVLLQNAPEVLLAAKQTMASANTDEGQGRTHQVTRFDMHTFALHPTLVSTMPSWSVLSTLR